MQSQLKYLLPVLVLLLSIRSLSAQRPMKELPGYARYQEINGMRRELSGGGRADRIEWSRDGDFVLYTADGIRRKLLLKTLKVTEATDEDKELLVEPKKNETRGKPPVARAQQRTTEVSPDSKWKAVYKNFNVVIEPNENKEEPIQVTESGTERLRYGTGCWVYGEELNQNEAMWWSPDSSKLVYYEVDEREMKDYYLTLDNLSLYTSLQSVRYPKAGDPNPKVGLWVYDLKNRQARKIEIEGEPMQYLYGIRFSPDGKEILVHRTNRRQDVMDLLAVDMETLRVRTVVTEKQSTWQENSPQIQFLKDQKRFVWETESSGWKQFQLRQMDGQPIRLLSEGKEYPCGTIVKIDEEAGYFYYTAFSDRVPYNTQLHRVRLDGAESTRITTSPLNHSSFEISPNHRFVIATRDQVDVPPATVLYDESGKELFVLAQADGKKAEEANLERCELFSYLASDGKTTLYGTLHKPSHFDPAKKYPLLIDVYGGPASIGLSTRYNPANAVCEFGYLVAKIGNRGTIGRGKAFESATYLKLGGLDLDDQAAGVKFLRERSYVDGERVGIYGHSYGGYMSALALVRYPDVFHAAVAGAPVTDFRNYDTIYTERYMQTPQENKEGYEFGSCMKYVDQFRGKLLLVHGLIDDNVHPSNTWQLAKALHGADKRFQMMIYPEFDHGVGSTYSALRWEFLHQALHPTVDP